MNYFAGVCQGLKAGSGEAYRFFIIGYLPDRQGAWPLCAIRVETASADAAAMKCLQNDALVLEKK
ncbi:MAG: hypothetical protein KQI81_06910 [Deltaproteobacteria bacterium]|nr:hypothetical protein [Deltaproteobacteria bacterium]